MHRALRPARRPFLVAALVWLAAGCASGDPVGSTGTIAPVDDPAVAQVIITRSRFEPATIGVTAGQRVRFSNTDPFAHTITSERSSSVPFDSGTLGQNEHFTATFDEAGTYAYFCAIHPTMRAEVVVR